MSNLQLFRQLDDIKVIVRLAVRMISHVNFLSCLEVPYLKKCQFV